MYVCNLFTHGAPRSSKNSFKRGGAFWYRIGIWKCSFFRRGEHRGTRRKTSRSREGNQQQTQPTYDAGSGNETRDTLVRGECFHHYANLLPKSILYTVLQMLLSQRNTILARFACLCLFTRFMWLYHYTIASASTPENAPKYSFLRISKQKLQRIFWIRFWWVFSVFRWNLEKKCSYNYAENSSGNRPFYRYGGHFGFYCFK